MVRELPAHPELCEPRLTVAAFRKPGSRGRCYQTEEDAARNGELEESAPGGEEGALSVLRIVHEGKKTPSACKLPSLYPRSKEMTKTRKAPCKA